MVDMQGGVNEGVDGVMEKLWLTIYDDNENTVKLSSFLVEDTNLVKKGEESKKN